MILKKEINTLLLFYKNYYHTLNFLGLKFINHQKYIYNP